MSNQPYNVWDIVNNPPEQALDVYGQAKINAWPCMLVSGQGKLPYDSNARTPEGQPYRAYTAVDVSVDPLSESGMQFETKRSSLAEFGEWKDITWPSLKGLGILNAQEIEGKFVRIELVPTGRKYTNSQGEEREAKAIKFTHVFADRAACVAAYTQEHKGNGNGSNINATFQAAQAAPMNNSGDREQQTALTFAKAFVTNAMRNNNRDIDKARAVLAGMLATNPIVSKFYSVDSPEIVALMAAEAMPF